MSAITDIVKGLFEPARALISEAITDKDKALEVAATLKLAEIETERKLLDYETQLTTVRAGVIETEAKGESWLQRNWRPLTMLTFVGLVVARWTGLTVDVGEPIEIQLMELIKIGLGGYVVGRSAEKIVPQVAAILKGNK